jgi:hypothetical protein
MRIGEENMTTLDANRALVRRFYEEVVNTGDVDLLDRFFGSAQKP